MDERIFHGVDLIASMHPFLIAVFPVLCLVSMDYVQFLSWTGVHLALSVTADLLEIVCTDNDPSAGSPTETLLRLLLPLEKYH